MFKRKAKAISTTPVAVNQPPPVRAKSIRSRKQLLLIDGLIVLGLAIIAVGVIYLFHRGSANSPTVKPTQSGAYNYTYSQLDSYTLKGVAPGSGASLSKPSTYKLIYESPDNSQASFRHSIIKSLQHATIGGIDMASLNQPSAITTAELNNLNTSFSVPAKTAYKSAVAPIAQFASDHLGPLYGVKLSDAAKFQSVFIHEHAWTWQLTATPKPITTPTAAASTPTAPFNTSSATPPPVRPISPSLPTYQGQIIFAAGRHTYYYFLIFNTDYNWANNTSAWAQTINSLKIDQ